MGLKNWFPKPSIEGLRKNATYKLSDPIVYSDKRPVLLLLDKSFYDPGNTTTLIYIKATFF